MNGYGMGRVKRRGFLYMFYTICRLTFCMLSLDRVGV